MHRLRVFAPRLPPKISNPAFIRKQACSVREGGPLGSPLRQGSPQSRHVGSRQPAWGTPRDPDTDPQSGVSTGPAVPVPALWAGENERATFQNIVRADRKGGRGLPVCSTHNLLVD